MQAAVLESPGHLKARDIPRPRIGARDVLVRVRCCGLCGTDLKLFTGDYVARLPVVPGHEVAGEVTAVGREVTTARPGDRVIVDPNQACGRCRPCRDNTPRFCERPKAYGVTVNGGFAEYLAVSARQIRRVPRGVDDVSACLAEPLACAVHAIGRAGVSLRTVVAIIGGGFQGQLLVQLATSKKAPRIIMVTRSRERLAASLRSGATDAVRSDDRSERIVRRLTGGVGVDVAIDSAGKPETLELAVRLLRQGGRAVSYGLSGPRQEASVSPFALTSRELAILGSWLYDPEDLRQALRLLASGAVMVNALVSYTFAISDCPRAFGLALEKAGGYMKSIMRMEGVRWTR